MKRSEMILHLKETLEEIEAAQKSRSPNDKNFHKRHAEDILDMILGFGMSPPGYEAVMATGKKYDKDLDQGRDTIWSKGWEPED